MNSKKHIPEETIDKYINSPDLLHDKDRFLIEKHISECEICRETYELTKRFYNEFDKRASAPDNEKDREIALRLLRKKEAKLLPSKAIEEKRYDSLVNRYTQIANPSLPQKIVLFLHYRPVTSAAVMFALLALFALPFMYMQTSDDNNPAFARVENYTLHVYNENGKMLWTESALGVPDLTSYTGKNEDDPERKYLMVDDIDGNGYNEVLLLSSIESELYTHALICFNHDGTMRWFGELPEPVEFGERDSTPFIRWRIRDFISFRPNEEHRKQLFLIAGSQFYPSILHELDPKDGTIKQTYWHTGHIMTVLPFDIHGDGNNEIIIGGVNNIFDNAFISVLNPLNISGYGRTKEEHIPVGIEPTNEKYYILFPKSSVCNVLNTREWNMTTSLRLTYGPTITVTVEELSGSRHSESARVLYVFDNMMNVITVTHSAEFRAIHTRLVEEGILDETLDKDYWDNLKNSVRYWDGERFVNEAVMNKMYEIRLPS